MSYVVLQGSSAQSYEKRKETHKDHGSMPIFPQIVHISSLFR